MAIIVLHDIVFNQAFDQENLALLVYLEFSNGVSFLPLDVQEWLDLNSIKIISETYSDIDNQRLRLVLRAEVESSLATYYLLRWGLQKEEVYF